MQKEKISSGFSEKLGRLKPGQTVRFLLMLAVKGGKRPSGGRMSHAEREAKIKTILESGERALTEIDAVLKQHGGRKLADRPNALGCIPMETTAGGIRALASLDTVRAVMEDQPLSMLP